MRQTVPTEILWSIQPTHVVELLTAKGCLAADWRRITFPEFKPAYKWMVAQMEARGIRTLGHSPFWAWHEKPDLRQAAHLPSKTRGCRLKLVVPRSLILFSDFLGWHSVLNNNYYPLEEEIPEWEQKLDQGYEFSDREILDSWQRIIQEAPNEDSQACLPYLDSAWLVSAQEFVAR